MVDESKKSQVNQYRDGLGSPGPSLSGDVDDEQTERLPSQTVFRPIHR